MASVLGDLQLVWFVIAVVFILYAFSVERGE